MLNDFVDFTDIAATILDLANIAEEGSGMQPITGTSWRELLMITGWAGSSLLAITYWSEKSAPTRVRPDSVGYPIRGISNDKFLLLKNYEPSRWSAGNPEAGYLDTDGGATKTKLLELGRADRSDKFWNMNFGFRPAYEFYDLEADPDCVDNLADKPEYQEMIAAMEAEMVARLEEQNDPRMFGKGEIFDQYPVYPPHRQNFYNRLMSGESEKKEAKWVNESDFEKEPVVMPTPPLN